MRECWINVYKSVISGIIWQGGYMASIEQANYNGPIASNLIYRIHVRMK